MSFFDEYNKTTTKKGTTTEVTPKNTPAVAPTGSFFNEFTAKKDTPVTPAPVVAPTPSPVSTLPRETISAPTGNEVLPVFDRIKDFTSKLLGINQTRTPADIIKDQQKAFESLVKNPSVQDTVDEFGNPVSPFKSVQTAREVRRSSIPTPKGIVEGLTDVSKSDTPFAGALLDAKEVGNVYLISQKLNKGKEITPEETIQLRDFFEKQDTLQKRRQGDAGYRIGEGLRNSLTFMAELGGASFVAPETGGTSVGGLIAQKGTLKATKEIATKMLEDKVTRELMTKQLKEYGIKAGQKSAVILGSQAAVHVPEDALTRMVGTPTFSNDMGSINVSVANDGQKLSDAVINAFTGSLIETTSEFTGGIFTALPNAVKNQLIKSSIIKATLNKNPGLSTNVITEFFKKAGWNGVVGEMGEEQIGNIMYGIAHQMGVSDVDFHVPTATELAEQFLSFALMGGFIKTLSTGYQKVIKDNLQKDLPKDVKDLSDTLNDVVSTGVTTDTPSDVVRALKDAGIDQNTAIKIVMEHADDQGQVDITPDALQAEIDAFMGTAPTEETTTPTVTETSQETTPQEDQVRQTTKMVETPFNMSEMDLGEEAQKKAEKDWEDNYAEQYQDKYEESQQLEKQLKNAKGEIKRTTQARLSTVNEQLQNLESEFLNKHAPEQAQEIEQLQGNITADTVKSEAPTFEPAPFNETFDESPVVFKTGSFVVDRDGNVQEIVSGNENHEKGTPTYDMNIGYVRTKTVGSEQDYLGHANQLRPATEEEVAQAKEYAKNNPIKEDTMAKIEKEAKATKKKVKKEKVKTESKKTDVNVGDTFNTGGVTNMKSPVTVTSIEGRTIKFKDADGTEYQGLESKVVKDFIKQGVWTKTEQGTTPIDNAGETVDNKVDEQGTRSNQIPDASEVPTGADLGRSSKTTSEVSGYDRAAMLVQSGNGLGSKGTNGLTKSQRQLINQEVEGLLEAKNYSQNPDDYTDTDKDLMRAYSGAGGKESVGGEGQGLLNEYYTPQEVVTTLWNIAERLSPNAETAFEPSAGTGRIISMSPASIATDGAEISKVSGTIAQVLNPDSKITIGDFQELFFDKKTNKAKTPAQYDIVIGNPPFGERAGFLKGKGEESTINRQEEYFIKRGLDMTKEGGYLIYVVNSSFLKTQSSKGKEAISKIGNLIGAYRLPEGTFEDTSIGTDIVIFRKEAGATPMITGDQYFTENPQHVLGETLLRKNRFGQTESYVKGDLATAMEKVNTILPEAVKTVDVTETPIVEENKPVLTKKRQESPKTTKKEGKITKKDTQATLPKNNATELVVPAQDISNKKTTNPVEIQMLKRIDRDMSIPTPSQEEMKYLNVGKGGKFYPDAIYFSGEVIEKLDLLAGNKKFIIDNYGEAQYEKQLKGLEAKVPATFPLKDIIFDPIDRHVAQLKAKFTNKFGEEVDGTVLTAFNSYIRANDVAMSPRVTKYDILRYVNGEQAAKDTKPIMGNIKNDAKRLFNHFIKHELDKNVQKDIEEKYNREKNGYVHPDYSQIPVEVKDMAKQFRGDDFKMSQTQKNGVGFLVNKGSGLIAYGVGVGKTHTLAIATKANMDKGWTKRPLFTVPKTTIDKTWIGTLHEMFPTLKINNLEGLQAPVIARLKRERGEDPKNWIKDDEFTVISHEGLLRLGFNEEELRSAAGDLQDAIWKDESTKRAKEGQKNKYDEILGNAQKYVTDIMLSDLGFDHISVDEVHNFRKIFQGAKPENLDENGAPVGRKRYGNVVGGTPSKRAQQLFLIAQYIQKKYGNRNVFLASATPFENHATEVYNILSLVARDRMKQMGILNINDFFSVFANFEVELDRKLNGEWLNSEKMKSFSNVQALQSLIKEFIDYQEDPTLVRPERRVITPHLQMSEKQIENLGKIQNLLNGTKEIVNDTQAFDEDSKTMYDVSSEGAEDGAFLKASTYSIANSVSPYFIKEYAGTVTDAKKLVEDSPKIKYTLEALKTLKEDPKTKDFGSFVFFGKMGVEYHPMLAEYFAKELGYKPEQVAYLSGNVTDEQKETIKERFNNGEIKVLLGGDQTKEGIDLQNNGFMTFNLALGWNPTQIAQVEGRVWRQGNKRSIAPLVYPLVENSGDAMIYNKFEEKGGRINDLFSYAGTMFDVGEVDPAEKKLTLLTDPKDKAKMQIEIDKTVLYNERVLIDNDIKALNKLRSDLKQSKEDLPYYDEQIKEYEGRDNEYSKDRAKEYKKEKKNAEARIERIEAKLKEKNITDLNATIGEMEGKMLDIDNKIKEIDKTYEPLLAKFTKEYQENIKKRKTIAQHMDEIKGLIGELKERTPEEIKALREQKIAELDAIKSAIPEFQRIEDTAEDVTEKAKLREDATVLMLDIQNNVGTEEERNNRYFDLMKRWEMLGRPMFERFVEEYTGTDKLTLKTIEKLKGKVTVSKQYISDLTNSGDIKQAERDAVREVLKEYPDATNILVKEFADKVNASLLPLESFGDTMFEDNTIARYEYVVLPDNVRGNVENYTERIYESPIETSAGDVHFGESPMGDEGGVEKYFAHTRIEDMGDKETRRVIEVQSDLFQKGRLEGSVRSGYDFEYLASMEEAKKRGDSYSFGDYAVLKKMKEKGELDYKDARKKLEVYNNVWWERILREEVKKAAQDEKTKLQFPTGETAMKIEGLGNEVLFAIETSTNTRVTPDRLVPGLRIVESRNRNGQEELGTRWTVTDILENGKFKAMKTSNVSTAPAKEARMIEQGRWNEIPDFMKETFDISGRIDTNNPIYKFYEKDVQRYLKNRYKAQEVTDEQGVTWVEVDIKPEMAKQPVEAFQRTTTSKEPTISFEEGKKRLEAYKKRLGLNFDVDFADVIFTGEYKDKVIPVKAYAVTYNNKITLTDNIKLTTADHEMVHIVVENIEKISAFDGITKEQLLRAQNGGKAYTEKDYERLNEELAIGFQKKVLGEEQSNVPMIIRRFYDKLQILLTNLFRALGMEVNVIKDFYNKMSVAKSTNKVELKSSEILDRRAQYERNGVKGLDFSFEQMKEMDDIRRAGFERMLEVAKDYSIDLKRKDINYIENLVAISRDIYLKDPVEFAQADEFMKIGDTRRMKKEILDKKFSDMLAPYFDLSKKEQEDVNMVLMQGDKDTREYTETELEKSGLKPTQIEAYKAVRKSFNTAHQLLIDEMEKSGVKPEEIETFKKERTGYMPHKWKYRFAIKTQTLTEGADPRQASNWKTQSMDVYETARKANKVFEQLKKDNTDPEHVRYVNDTLDSLDVDFFSEQRFSFENMKSMIAKAKTGADVKDEMISAMRDIIKEKGFGRHFIKRTGIQGYETKEVPEIIANYFAGLDGFVTKMEAGKQYYAVLEKIDARRQKNFYAWIRDSIAYDMGNTKEWDTLKKFAFVYSLANDMSFLLTNATQNWVVGVGELTKLYKDKTSKIAGAEATLMKATADWATGNITPEERQVIEGLIKVGRLGGEMTSELMGFKNNPIYASMGSWWNTALYSTTAFVEKNVNRVPAFLSARRILKAQGLSDKEANEEALKVSDDINFRGGKQHRPVFMRGRIGTIFVFNTYIRSFLYQLSRDLKEKQFMSIAKKMFYTSLLGGLSALPFAKLIMSIVEAILPPDPEEETKDELGTWEYALKKGPINAFLNLDLSSRVNINIFGVDNIIKDPKNLLSWLGAIGSLIGKRIPDGITLYQQDRYLEAFGKLMPDFLANPLKAYNGHIYGVTTMNGNPLIDENGEEFKYTTYEAFIKAFGYSPARESIAWDETNKEWVAKSEQSDKASMVQNKIKRQIREGDLEGARQTQQEGLSSGAITDKSTDYVKKAVTEQVMQTKYDEWNAGTKSRPMLDKMEREIAREIYGDTYTKLQLTNVTRDFAFYRTFGFNDELANSINKAQSTAEKVEILKKARENMTLEEFKAFWNKGRTVVKYESTSTGAENTGYVLISDALRKAYFAK